MAAGIFIAGYRLGSAANQDAVSFYATLLEQDGQSILVEGIPENDVNHRGKFWVSPKENAPASAVTDQNGAPMAMSRLPVGGLLRITYTGAVLETDPAQIREALQISVVQ